ncbi:MAG: beta-ketoacyl-[acyl-carrier-protein] synthase family protein, partial [Bacteroidales bacterium]|nr:beta-ketoacyl-[acyl-carrier-protein] synthase family protein [Bacteroidales bacterium]
VSSTKAFTGHTTSASGSIEAVLSLMVLEHQQIPVNLRYTRRTEGLSFDAATSPQPLDGIRHVLSNSFGFGGNDTSCIFSKL